MIPRAMGEGIRLSEWGSEGVRGTVLLAPFFEPMVPHFMALALYWSPVVYATKNRAVSPEIVFYWPLK